MYLDSREYKEPSQDKERPKGGITQPPLEYPVVVLPSIYLFIYLKVKKKKKVEKLEEVGLSGPGSAKRKETRMVTVYVDACIHCRSKALL